MFLFRCFRSEPDAGEPQSRPPAPAQDKVVDVQKLAKQKEAISKSNTSSEPGVASWEKQQLDSLPANFLTVARGAKKVSIAENTIVTFDIDLSSLVSSITILDISDNRICSLPPTLCLLVQLECLYGYKNQITSLPADIGKLRSLKELNVFNNKITDLPASINDLSNLELLNVASNLLGKSPLPSLNGLTNLKRLALFWNKITTLPSLDGLVNVAEIQLQKNQLSTLPSLHTLTSLKTLTVNDNRLTSIPPSIGKCVSLEELSASKNLIESIPREIASCPALSKLVLSQNRIAVLTDDVLLPAYEKIDLADNLLETLPPKIATLQNLAILFVQGNKLTSLPEALANLSGLKRVDLSGNPLPAGLPLEDTLRRYCEANQGKFLGSQKGGGKK